MRELDGINVTIEALGESRIVDINSSNPTAGLARAAMNRTRRGFIATGFWFNTIFRDATPTTTTGFINVPWAQLSLYDSCTNEKYGERDGVLYDLAEQTKVFTDTVHLKITLDIEFEDLPEHCAMWVAYATAAEVYLNDLGADGNYQQLVAKAAEYESLNYREHLRNQKYSTARTRTAGRIAYGFRI